MLLPRYVGLVTYSYYEAIILTLVKLEAMLCQAMSLFATVAGLSYARSIGHTMAVHIVLRRFSSLLPSIA